MIFTYKKDLLVTTIDNNYIDQAKQLFSSVYFNGSWEGDYMVLTYGIEDKDLEWFKKKEIIVIKIKKLQNRTFGENKFPPIVFARFYLFKSYFKKWKKILFLDSDIIVKDSLKDLKNISKFHAIRDSFPKLNMNFYRDLPIYEDLNLSYDLNIQPFNAGVFCFDTKIIKKETYKEIINLHKKFYKICRFDDQSILNLYFYKKWKPLPLVFNNNPDIMKELKIKIFDQKKIKSVILHFFGSKKPWKKDSKYFKEWEENLKKADLINLKKRIIKPRIISKKEIITYSREILKEYDEFKKVIFNQSSK